MGHGPPVITPNPNRSEPQGLPSPHIPGDKGQRKEELRPLSQWGTELDIQRPPDCSIQKQFPGPGTLSTSELPRGVWDLGRGH
jgi:hypothetical protein